MRKIVVVDIYNTLLDSRHRQCSNLFFFSLIHNDTINYPVLQTIRAMQAQGCKVVFFAYSNARYKSVVQQVLNKVGFRPDEYDLYVDYGSKHVYNSVTLKEQIYDSILHEDDIVYAIDRDIESIDFWKSKDILVMTPQYE